MPIEGFDYKGFAQAMSEQAVGLVPQDLNEQQKEYVVKTLGNFTMLAGEAAEHLADWYSQKTGCC